MLLRPYAIPRGCHRLQKPIVQLSVRCLLDGQLARRNSHGKQAINVALLQRDQAFVQILARQELVNLHAGTSMGWFDAVQDQFARFQISVLRHHEDPQGDPFAPRQSAIVALTISNLLDPARKLAHSLPPLWVAGLTWLPAMRLKSFRRWCLVVHVVHFLFNYHCRSRAIIGEYSQKCRKPHYSESSTSRSRPTSNSRW